MFNQFNPNSGFQNTVTPSNENLGMDNYFGQNLQVPYIQGVNNGFMPNNMSQDMPYPSLQSSTATPAFNAAPYAQGGEVKGEKKRKSQQKDAPYKILAQMIQSQGKGQDTILAHINPLEAMILKNMGSSGTINPKTGLMQFGFFDNPGKWLKSVAGPVGGAILGNMLMPGVGGMLGAALGGAAGSAARGRKDGAQAAIRGLGIGAALPTAASLAGSGVSALGGKGLGDYLSQYGKSNAIMPSIDKLFGLEKGVASAGTATTAKAAPAALLASYSSPSNLTASAGTGATAAAGAAAEGDFLGNLTNKTKDFLSEPANLLTLASVGSQMANRPKEKSPEKLAAEQKRLQRALQLSPEELQNQEAYMLASEQMKRRIAKNKFLPEERLGNIDPMYMRTNTPEEYATKRKWIEYYDNPDFKGEPLRFAEGGSPLLQMLMHPSHADEDSKSGYIHGMGGGQDDDVRKGLRPKTYIVDASTVSNLGDGNSAAGAHTLDNIEALVSNGEYEITPERLTKLGKGNPDRGIKMVKKMVTNVRKHKSGGSTKLPPKAKSLKDYMRG